MYDPILCRFEQFLMNYSFSFEKCYNLNLNEIWSLNTKSINSLITNIY